MMKYFFSKENVSLATIDGADNRKALAESKGFDIMRLTCGEQVHSTNVVVVDSTLVGRGALDMESRIPECDALVTDLKGVCLMMLTADCVPILLYDRGREVIAAVHAGWMGTAGSIVKRTIEVMKDRFCCKGSDMVAYIGPAICGKCFEVGEEVVEAIGKRFVSGKSKNGRPLIDLKYANTVQLQECGLVYENIRINEECTMHGGLKSWRRERTLERIGSGIWME